MKLKFLGGLKRSNTMHSCIEKDETKLKKKLERTLTQNNFDLSKTAKIREEFEKFRGDKINQDEWEQIVE